MSRPSWRASRTGAVQALVAICAFSTHRQVNCSSSSADDKGVILRLGPLEFSAAPVLIATTPWATTSGESFYQLNATTIVGSTNEGPNHCRVRSAVASLFSGRCL